ncbi:MAG TPA: hypothetical protein PK158_13730 [Spirochaetota bacterium]|nr:hypothetical protein [Spirochaetota bacterium]
MDKTRCVEMPPLSEAEVIILKEIMRILYIRYEDIPVKGEVAFTNCLLFLDKKTGMDKAFLGLWEKVEGLETAGSAK